MTIHPSITVPRMLAMLTEHRPGVCVRCGEDAWGVEPDTVQPVRCPRCGELSVLSPAQVMGYWRAKKRMVVVTAPWQTPHRGVGVHIDFWTAFTLLILLWFLGLVIGLWWARA